MNATLEPTYTDRDRIACLRDLIATQGQLIGIGGHLVRAYVENQMTNRESDESGADAFSDEKQVTFELTAAMDFNSETILKIRDRSYTATSIEPIGDVMISATVDLA